MNASINELCHHLVTFLLRGELTPDQLRRGMHAAYEGGRIDGELVAVERRLKEAFGKDQEAMQATLRG
jgi:hypothetical protein